MTRVARTWTVIAPIVGVGVVLGLGAIHGWPGWWISLMILTAIAAIGYGVVDRRAGGVPSHLAAATIIAVAVASLALTVSAVADLRGDRALTTARDDVRRISGPLVCTTLLSRTGADRLAAEAAATGELGARLRSGSAAADSDQAGSITRCVPARTGLGAVATDSAEVVVAANVTERVGSDDSASGRVVAARLEKVGGTWRVATLDVIR